MLLQGSGGLAAGGAERGIGLIAKLAGSLLRQLQGLQGSFATAGGQLLPQAIAQGDQASQILAMAPLQGLELGHALLQLRQAFWVTIKTRSVAIQIAGQILQSRQTIAAATAQLTDAAI